MKIVDTRSEQDVLESLLEASKPPRPAGTEAPLHHLLATPFRYHPLRAGSRFRSATDPGVYYGAGSVHTAAAELGYWRWRFLIDAVDMDRIEPVAHTAFKAEIDASAAIDLRREPFDVDEPVWTAPDDYGPTQEFARVVREAEVDAIVYRSVRDPQPAGRCLALLAPRGFARKAPYPQMQTWFLAVAREQVSWRRDSGEGMQFGWGGEGAPNR
ncbi:RES family NAD+ phosphorylase [Piscinibacter sakaiensis]|uniref:RES family NAD+ phosphorylase n=1 Tax=Piscinibacter sakaiensis TaxID=1547922 RepID=UPI003AAF3758